MNNPPSKIIIIIYINKKIKNSLFPNYPNLNNPLTPT